MRQYFQPKYLSNSRRTQCFLWISPINTGEKIGLLGHRYSHGLTRYRGPYELASLKSFYKQACALRIMPDNFNQIRATPSETEQVATQRILFQDLLNLQSQAGKAATLMRCST